MLASVLFVVGCSDAATVDPPVADARDQAPSLSAPKVVVLLSIDALRPDHLGAYGYERFTSPVIDGIAREGVVFEDASAAAPWTLPSHASILTGLFPATHRVTRMKSRLPEGVPTLASMLSAAGYRTAAVVNVAWLKRESFQLTREFDDYLWVKAGLDRKSANNWVTDQAIEWLQGLGAEERLFLFVHWYDLHSDYAAAPAYEKLFVGPYEGPADGTAWQLKQASLSDEHVAFCREQFDPEVCRFGKFKLDPSSEKVRFDDADIEHLKNLYDAQIRQTDAELGRLFAAMRARGLYEDAVIVLTSDHGQEFHEHGGVEHLITTYQEVLRVPLLMRGPGLPAGARVGVPVSSVDLVPTIAALTGAEVPAEVEGLDLSPLWTGGEEKAFGERLLFGEASGGSTLNARMSKQFFPSYSSVRRGSHKLVVEWNSGTSGLYDLAADPFESRDLSGEQPELARDLREILEARRAAMVAAEMAETGEDEAPISEEDLERLRALGYIP